MFLLVFLSFPFSSARTVSFFGDYSGVRFSLDAVLLVLYIFRKGKIFSVIMCLCWSELWMSCNIDKHFSFSSFFFSIFALFTTISSWLLCIFLIWPVVRLEIQLPTAMQKFILHAKQFYWSRAEHQLVAMTHIEVFMRSGRYYFVDSVSFFCCCRMLRNELLSGRKKKLERLNYSEHSYKMCTHTVRNQDPREL